MRLYSLYVSRTPLSKEGVVFWEIRASELNRASDWGVAHVIEAPHVDGFRYQVVGFLGGRY